MANKRDLKRTINYITSELFAETVAASLYNGKPSQEDVDGILSSIVMVNNDFIKRVSHPEPGIKPGAYYQNLIHDFNKQVSEIIDQIPIWDKPQETEKNIHYTYNIYRE